MATSVEAATSSHIEEMIKEPVQPKSLEVPATGMILESTTTTAGEPSFQSNLPKDLPSLDPQFGKRTKILHVLPFSLLSILGL